MNTTIQNKFRSEYSEGFTQEQIENVCTIIGKIEHLLTGKMDSLHSGGGHYHFALQMKDNKWLTFHALTGDITVSGVPYETIQQFGDAFFDEHGWENVAALGVETEHEGEFNEPEIIADRILNKEFKPVF